MKEAGLKILGALPFFLVPAAFIASVWSGPALTGMTPEEKRLFYYEPEEERVARIKTHEEMDTAFVRDPGFFDVKREGNGLATAKAVGRKSGEKKERGAGLTLLVHNGERSMAIIDGAVVRQGERLGGLTVKRIEKDRVLVVDKSPRWIYMEGAR